MSESEKSNPATSPDSSHSALRKYEVPIYMALPPALAVALFEVLKKLAVNTKGSEIPEVLLAAFATCMGGAVLAANRFARNQEENSNDQEESNL